MKATLLLRTHSRENAGQHQWFSLPQDDLLLAYYILYSLQLQDHPPYQCRCVYDLKLSWLLVTQMVTTNEERQSQGFGNDCRRLNTRCYKTVCSNLPSLTANSQASAS